MWHIVHKMDELEARGNPDTRTWVSDSTHQDKQPSEHSTNVALDIEMPPGPSRSSGEATGDPCQLL